MKTKSWMDKMKEALEKEGTFKVITVDKEGKVTKPKKDKTLTKEIVI